MKKHLFVDWSLYNEKLNKLFDHLNADTLFNIGYDRFDGVLQMHELGDEMYDIKSDDELFETETEQNKENDRIIELNNIKINQDWNSLSPIDKAKKFMFCFGETPSELKKILDKEDYDYYNV